jgi:hypothetical protein
MPSELKFSVADLDAARAELQRIEQRWENYSGNNPNKFVSDLNAARSKVAAVTRTLKAQGDLPLTPHEELCTQLDQIAPDARQNEIVEYEGDRYRRVFSPAKKSLSGKTVTEWDRTWTKL